ncbi:DUF6777 domain-containing protein [Streptomyces yaanensis]|uniref:DUF6777 domain-containing protein n=1 Tax=Streptomyces yaanensis TaxID=1142239 RepID=A0ABV7S6D7_9ACTN|nr:DUF6777 domain-containing protein [Streptomyces sp. CGMCC 4.7035]WNC00108.1 DUF6777-containing protein [Streptomyces sp. CGMCC 4.7035]
MKTPIRALNAPLRTLVAACALSVAALLCAGCADGNILASGTRTGGEIFLQPAAAQGPDPFTASTVVSAVASGSVTRTPQAGADRSTSVARSFSGATPGLYGGTQSVGSCDVERQTAFLTADRARGRAFAQASGIGQASIPAFLHGLTSVVLRADTRVTNHGFRDGRATGYQSVLEAGTAVLVDGRGVPRVRCACGNPIDAPAAVKGAHATSGRSWTGYRPAQVITVIPAPQTVTHITIISIEHRNTWIERRIGDDGHRDVVVRPQPAAVGPPKDTGTDGPRLEPSDRLAHELSSSASGDGASPAETWPSLTVGGASPGETRPSLTGGGASPQQNGLSPQNSADDCATPTPTVSPTVTPGMPDVPSDGSSAPGGTSAQGADPRSDCATATATATSPATRMAPPTTSSGTSVPSSAAVPPPAAPTGPTDQTNPTDPIDPSATAEPAIPFGSPGDDIGPSSVPEVPDVPDGGGLIPDDTSTADVLFDSPAGVFNG